MDIESNNNNMDEAIGKRSEKKKKGRKSKLLSIILELLLVLSLFLSVGLYGRVNKLENQILELENNQKIVKNILKLQSTEITKLNLSKSIDEGVVTDKFFVHKSLFFDDEAVIDIDLQPSIVTTYVGEGKFNIDDNELKKYIMELLVKVGATYDEGKLDEMKAFKDLKVHITIKNYDVAMLENGTLSLVKS